MRNVFILIFLFCGVTPYGFAADAHVGSQANAPAMTNAQKNLLWAPLADAPDAHRFWQDVNQKPEDLRPGSGDEKKMAREAWEEMLGYDPFVPYYEARKIKDSVEDKTQVKLWKFKGRAHFDTAGNKADYKFQYRF